MNKKNDISKSLNNKEFAQAEKSEKSNSFYKNFFIKYGIIFLLFLFMFFVIFGFSFLCGIVQKNNYKKCINKTLETYYEANSKNKMFAAAFVNPSFFPSNNLVIYKLEDSKSSANSENQYVILVRIATVYGPLPVLFIYNKSINEVVYVDIMTLNSSSKNRILSSLSTTQIALWKNKLLELGKSYL